MTSARLISVELGDVCSRPFKSIKHVVWQDIPPLAVLTGLNGSGKTQLLQALAFKLTKVRAGHFNDNLHSMPLSIEGISIDPHEVAYLPSSENGFRVSSTNIGAIYTAKIQIISSLSPEYTQHDIDKQILRERIERKFGIKIDGQLRDVDANKLPDDFLYMLEYNDVCAGLGYVFFGYQVRKAERLLSGVPEAQILKDIGPPPWQFLNETLKNSGFNYRIIPPENKLLKEFYLQVEDITSGNILDVNDLSSGEKIILRTILWLYNSMENGIFPKLLLLDEPDAHLHPSMTRQFLDVVKGVLVDRYGVRVILTTHSPSTVAMAPDESIFVMVRDEPRIRRPASKAEAIGMLTAGLVTVSSGTRMVFVEDEQDARFYGAVRDVLSDQGPSKDQRALKPAPSLVFMPASIGRGSSKIGGGKTVVTQWVAKFDTLPLYEIFCGIIDYDSGNTPSDRIHVIGRYSIENYQLDPTIVFGVLLEEGRLPSFNGLNLTSGDEHRLRTIPAAELQIIADLIIGEIENKVNLIDEYEKIQEEVAFTNGAKVMYPRWIKTTRGHDLLRMYQEVFGQGIINSINLEKSFRRVRLVPIELADIMTRIQSPADDWQ